MLRLSSFECPTGLLRLKPIRLLFTRQNNFRGKDWSGPGCRNCVKDFSTAALPLIWGDCLRCLRGRGSSVFLGCFNRARLCDNFYRLTLLAHSGRNMPSFRSNLRQFRTRATEGMSYLVPDCILRLCPKWIAVHLLPRHAQQRYILRLVKQEKYHDAVAWLMAQFRKKRFRERLTT